MNNIYMKSKTIQKNKPKKLPVIIEQDWEISDGTRIFRPFRKRWKLLNLKGQIVGVVYSQKVINLLKKSYK